jgi:hypothetical protein
MTFTVLPDWLAPSGHFSGFADYRLVNGLPQGIPSNKHRRSAKIHHARPTHLLCADGHTVDYSVSGAG